LAGGVAANRSLRKKLAELCQKNKLIFLVPELELSTDNAQMIAMAAYFQLQHGQKARKIATIRANPAWGI
jgi:N6-L-threonylcarbamoyladenine synthase